MNTNDLLSSEIELKFGSVKRARGCFLYTVKGIRLTDMYQEGGRAILGWGGSQSFTVFKNILSRGITGSYKTGMLVRLEKSISELLDSDRKILIYADKQKALKAALSLSSESTFFWKPWNSENVVWNSVDCVILEPPLPWTSTVFLVAVKKELIQKSDLILPAVVSIPAPLLAAITRANYDMIKALQERQEKDWFLYDTILIQYWIRKGPYLYPRISSEHYNDFMLHCLNCNLVISPDYEIPSIVPFGADKGVFNKLKNNPFVTE